MYCQEYHLHLQHPNVLVTLIAVKVTQAKITLCLRSSKISSPGLLRGVSFTVKSRLCIGKCSVVIVLQCRDGICLDCYHAKSANEKHGWRARTGENTPSSARHHSRHGIILRGLGSCLCRNSCRCNRGIIGCHSGVDRIHQLSCGLVYVEDEIVLTLIA